MYRVKLHLWLLCRAFLELLCLDQHFLLHVWAKIVPRVRFLCFLHILHNSPLKNAACSCYICISGLFVGFCSPFACFACKKRRMLRLKSPFWPAWCLLPFLMVFASRILAFWRPKGTYFTGLSTLRLTIKKCTYFTMLSGLSVACVNGANWPEGRFSSGRWPIVEA